MKEFVDFLRFTLSPIEEWTHSALFLRDLTMFGTGMLFGVCIALWVLTPRWR